MTGLRHGSGSLNVVPYPGEFDSSRVPTPGNLPSKAKKNANARGSARGGGRGGGWAQVELTDALEFRLNFEISQLALSLSPYIPFDEGVN